MQICFGQNVIQVVQSVIGLMITDYDQCETGQVIMNWLKVMHYLGLMNNSSDQELYNQRIN